MVGSSVFLAGMARGWAGTMPCLFSRRSVTCEEIKLLCISKVVRETPFPSDLILSTNCEFEWL